uniref:Anaphase-promoting complex subunit 4-like WD40 domain-containing protein n=1 Tax=Ditylum brightwellii TaxID=49249 RepID=A0A6U3R608_9STRA|mmetsp:Transcript_26682/g.39641  ORF Transcript_26682/g.39641 Transcript_26682/m.39641 type:complete len:1298 (+) Transcript_26682:377-4270(+)
MGNSKSKNKGPYAGHELLDENDEKYFAKVRARNRVKSRDTSIPQGGVNSKSSKKRLLRKKSSKRRKDGKEAKSDDTVLTSLASPPKEGDGVRGRTAMLERAGENGIADGSGAMQYQGRVGVSVDGDDHVAGPLSHTTLPLQESIMKSKPHQKVPKKRRERREAPGRLGNSEDTSGQVEGGTNNSAILKLPSPRDTRALRRPQSHETMTPSSSKLKSPSRSAGTGLYNVASEMSSNRKGSKTKNKKTKQSPVEDYYVEMMRETTGTGSIVSSTSTEQTSPNSMRKNRGNVNRAFEATLPSGMVWTDISRGGKVTCLALSPAAASPPAQGFLDSCTPLLLAIGTDDGFVTVVEIMDDANGSAPEEENGVMKLLGGNKHKYGNLREIPREGKIRSLDFSPDGQRLVVGGDDCTAAVIDVGYPDNSDKSAQQQSLPPLRVLHEMEREDRVYTTKYSPDGSMIAIGGFDGMVAIASVPPEEKKDETPVLDLIAEIPRLGLVLSVDWSPDGSLLAIGGSDKRAAIVETTCGQFSEEDGHMIDNVGEGGGWDVIGEIQRPATVQCVRWSPDGAYLAVGGHDGHVAVVDINNRSIVKDISRNPDDEETSEMGSISGSIKGGGGTASTTASSASCHISSVCWSPDGAFVAVGGTDDLCAIIETKSFALVHEIRRGGHVTCVDWGSQAAAGSAKGGRFLAVGGDDKHVAVLKTGSEWDRSQGSITGTISLDTGEDSSLSSRSIVSGSTSEWVLKDNTFEDMDEDFNSAVKSGLINNKVTKNDDGELVVTAVCFSLKNGHTGESEYIAVAGSNGSVTIFSTADWTVLKKMSFSKSIHSLCFSNKNQYIVMGGDDSTAHILSVQTWEKVTDITADSSIYTVAFSMMDERLAFGTLDGVLTLLDAQNGFVIVGEMDTNTAPILTLDWSSNGKYMALGRNDASVTIHDSQSVFGNFFVPQKELHRGSGAPIHTVAFGDGGTFLAVGGGDWMVAIYSAEGGWVLCHELKMDGWVLSVAWSSDSRFLGIGGTELSKGGRVIDTASWDTIEELRDGQDSTAGFGTGEEVTSLGWSDDGRWFIVAGKGGNARIVDTETWELVRSIGQSDSSFGKVTNGNDKISIEPQPEQILSNPVKNKGLEDLQQHFNNDFRTLDEVEAIDSIKKIIEVSPEEAIGWNQRSIVHRFLEVCDAFLTPYEFDEPPDILRMYVPCILMLQVHVKWVASQSAQNRSKVERKDDGEPLLSLHNILVSGIEIIELILDDEDNINTWWDDSQKFRLTPKDRRRINVWNESWLKIEREAPIVDVDLLVIANS